MFFTKKYTEQQADELKTVHVGIFANNFPQNVKYLVPF